MLEKARKNIFAQLLMTAGLGIMCTSFYAQLLYDKARAQISFDPQAGAAL